MRPSHIFVFITVFLLQQNPPSPNVAAVRHKQKLDTTADESLVATHEPQTKKPKPRASQASKMHLNELYIGRKGDNGIPDQQFVEIKMHCPKRGRPKTTSLGGYWIVALELGTPTDVVLVADLHSQNLVNVNEDGITSYYHVIGTRNVEDVVMTFDSSSLSNWHPIQYVNYPDPLNVLPEEGEIPVAIFLLYYTVEERKSNKNAPLLMSWRRVDGIPRYFTTTISKYFIAAMKDNIVDYIIYGNTFTHQAEGFLKDLTSNSNFNLHNTMVQMTANLPIPVSYSVCKYGTREKNRFQFLVKSPLKDNKCVQRKYPFKFEGRAIQSTGQHLIANMLYFLENNPKRNDICEGGPQMVVSRLLGISRQMVAEVKRRYIGCNIRTPGKTRQGNKWKQNLIDSFDRDRIRSMIAQFYKDNMAPFFDDIYNMFMAYKKDNCVTYTSSVQASAPSRWLPICPISPNIEESNEESGSEEINSQTEDENSIENEEDNISSSNHPIRHSVHINEGFTCSKITFGKVLRQMGFYYGRLDKRIALLQRPDIVARRGNYLKVLRDNAASANPMKVTYLDETWIDPNHKLNKGWTLKKPKTIRECAKYSYRRLKQGHGPRIIALAAASDDGIIKSSVLVYKVQKNANALDYHENVNKEGFLNWINSLFDEYDRRGEKHIIVVDNAPYHSSLLTPKSSDRKEKLMQWLRKVNQNPEYRLQMTLNPKMLKWELWQLIQSLKKRPELSREVYELDQLAASRGHIILRLPPYQCCFNPIEYLWNVAKHHIAKQNIRQDLDEMIKIAREVLINYDVDKWKAHVKKCKELEDKYWQEDGWMENDIDPIIIPLDEEEEDVCDEYMGCGDDDCDECELDSDDFFDPDEIQRQWQQDREDVTAFHASADPSNDYIPRVRGRRLFCDPEMDFDES